MIDRSDKTLYVTLDIKSKEMCENLKKKKKN